MIVSQPREKLWAWMNNRIGTPWSEDFRALGLVKDDCLIAVIGYNGFTGRVCFIHNAIDDPTKIDRTFVRESFRYPFEVCGMEEILAPVPAGNHRAVKLNMHLGFREVHRIPGGSLEGDDLLLLSMRKSECRFLKGRFDGKEKFSSTAGLPRSSGRAGGSQPGDHDRSDLGKPPQFEHTLGKPDLAVSEGY